MGSTMVGNLARVGFEAPGMLILIAAHRELERLTLSNRQQNAKATIGTTYGDLLHEAVYYDPILDDYRAFLDSCQNRVSGDVRVRLHKGNIVLLGEPQPLQPARGRARLGSTYGHGSSLWTGEEARAFAHIYATAGAPAQAVAEDGQG